MGITKALQERIFIAANVLRPQTRFICVRYGNVMASRGSVIPLFLEQIRLGGPVTVTVPEMTRFLLSIDEAVDTVYAALKHAKPGETFVPHAPSATVLNLAKALIDNRDIEIQVTGIRPGEKMHEIMISDEEINHVVRHNGYYAIRPYLPELRVSSTKNDAVLDGALSSHLNVLDLAGTRTLLERNGLLKGDAKGEKRYFEMEQTK